MAQRARGRSFSRTKLRPRGRDRLAKTSGACQSLCRGKRVEEIAQRFRFRAASRQPAEAIKPGAMENQIPNAVRAVDRPFLLQTGPAKKNQTYGFAQGNLVTIQNFDSHNGYPLPNQFEIEIV